MLSDMVSTSKEREFYEIDHDYEMLDKYNQHYEDIQAPPPKLEDDYKSTPCPAYVSVATTSIHSDDELETSFIGSTMMQDDQKDDEIM